MEGSRQYTVPSFNMIHKDNNDNNEQRPISRLFHFRCPFFTFFFYAQNIAR